MEEKLIIKVQYPQQEMLVPVSVSAYDTARVIATSGPPLTKPVIILHQGHCLSPHLTLAAQGVTNGDTVILHTVSYTNEAKLTPTKAEKQHMKVKIDEVFNELLRLADVAFMPYEIGLYGGLIFQQMLSEIPDETEPETSSPTILGPKATDVANSPLPILWKGKGNYNEESNGKGVIPKVSPLPKRKSFDGMQC